MSILQSHAECTGDRAGFLTLYRSNTIRTGSHDIHHSHCIKIKPPSSPEGSPGSLRSRTRRAAERQLSSDQRELRAKGAGERLPTSAASARGKLGWKTQAAVGKRLPTMELPAGGSAGLSRRRGGGRETPGNGTTEGVFRSRQILVSLRPLPRQDRGLPLAWFLGRQRGSPRPPPPGTPSAKSRAPRSHGRAKDRGGVQGVRGAPSPPHRMVWVGGDL